MQNKHYAYHIYVISLEVLTLLTSLGLLAGLIAKCPIKFIVKKKKKGKFS